MDHPYLLIYSETSLSFLKKCQQKARTIVKNELGLNFKRSRFLYKNHLYPLELIVFEHPKELGFFDPVGYRIGINKRLMYRASEEVIENILRHELAHLICYIEHGSGVMAHGVEFQEICQRLGWDKNISKATFDLQEQGLEGQKSKDDEKVIGRVQKILRLASSSNEHESKLATAKANEILLTYNLEAFHSSENQGIEDQTCLKKVAQAKRNNAKLHAIYEILGHFFVRPVFNYGKGQVYLEVIGRRVNVEMAEYVADFLNYELDILWQQAQRENPKLKGLKAKNSFFNGLAQGFCQKIKSSKSKSNGKEMIKLDLDLDRRVQTVYGRLSMTKTRNSQDLKALGLGIDKGKNLSIRPALRNESKKSSLLTWGRS